MMEVKDTTISPETLISKKLFDRVQQVLVQRSKPLIRGKIAYPFVGLMRGGGGSSG